MFMDILSLVIVLNHFDVVGKMQNGTHFRDVL